MIHSIDGIAAGYLRNIADDIAVNRKKALSDNANVQQAVDSVTLSSPPLLVEEKIPETMASVENAIRANIKEALSAHQGLDFNRVMALLEGS
jgi:hypothetical protein